MVYRPPSKELRAKQAERGDRDPPRGHHAFKLTASSLTGTHAHFACAVCGLRCASYGRDQHALGRSARGKAAVRKHVLEAHPEQLIEIARSPGISGPPRYFVRTYFLRPDDADRQYDLDAGDVEVVARETLVCVLRGNHDGAALIERHGLRYERYSYEWTERVVIERSHGRHK